MKQIRDKVGGLDVHRDNVVACTRVAMPDGSVEVAKERFSTTQAGLAELTAFLMDAGVEHRGDGGDGVYWRTVYYALEGLFEELWLCNAQHVKNVPGRKSDLSDAEWLADVAAHGMVRPSFVPPPDIRELRELTRYRKTQVDARAKEIQRLEKCLQDAGVKLTSVASTVWSKSSRAMIEAMIAGERDSVVLADHGQGGPMRKKTDRLEEALESNFGSHHAILCRQIIDHLDFLDASIATLRRGSVPGSSLLSPRSPCSPRSRGLGDHGASHRGRDRGRHEPVPDGRAPVRLGRAWPRPVYESAGKKRPAGTRHGAPWLRRTLIEAARSAARTKGSYYSALYARIARRRGPNKAAVAVAHSMLETAWHLLSTGALYQDPGADYFERRHDPVVEAKRLQRRIEASRVRRQPYLACSSVNRAMATTSSATTTPTSAGASRFQFGQVYATLAR
jgi:transposase